MLSQVPNFLANNVHAFPDNTLNAKLVLEGTFPDKIDSIAEKDEKEVGRFEYLKELIDQQTTKLRMGGRFDEGNIIGGRWAIIANLAGSDEISNGAFNGGINKVKDLHTGRICIQKLLAPRSSSNRFSGVAEREINILRQLKHLNIVQVVGYELPEHRCDVPSMYIEYCEQGTLEKVAERYIKRDKYVPEAFLWKVFEGLASAALHCHEGPEESLSGLTKSWDPVYHRDIILTNCFLSKSDEGGYPVVKLGDFGCSVTQSDMLYGGLLDQDLPAEDYRYVPPEGPDASAAADIFQIGLVMFCFYINSIIPDKSVNNRGCKRFTDHKFWIDERRPGFQNYSRKFRYLIARCVAKLPEHRPNARVLLDLIKETKMELVRRNADAMQFEPLL